MVTDKMNKLGDCQIKDCRGFSKQVNHDYCLECKKLLKEHLQLVKLHPEIEDLVRRTTYWQDRKSKGECKV